MENKYLLELGARAQVAAQELMKVDVVTINQALLKMAEMIEAKAPEIIKANSLDVEAARPKIDAVMLDRLTLTPARVVDLAVNLRQVAGLDSPLNKVEYSHQSLKGFKIQEITVPLGVIAMIYEARPNVTTEAMSLGLKSGNVTVLRGSSTTLHTNKKLIELVTTAGKAVGLPDNFVQLIETTAHSDVTDLVKMNGFIDVVIPRGGERLINNVIQNATVPIIETGTGNNFAYIDATADFDAAIDVLVNAKAQRPTVCNSLEKILVHKDVPVSFLQKLEAALLAENVLIKAHDNIIGHFEQAVPVPDAELTLEYLDYIIGIKQVASLDEAISIINKYSSKHSQLILSTSFYEIERFTAEIDSACVFVNMSTRFADGGEFGLGSEIGISTQKLHARGPMGLKALTSTKSIVVGSYQVRV